MKKLLLLAIIGLLLGAGIWKSQNPEGTIAEFQKQSITTAKRLAAGVEAGIDTVKDQPTAVKEEVLAREELENRLVSLETQLNRTSEISLEDQITDIISAELADTRAMVQSLVESNSNLESTVSELESPEATRAVASTLQALESRVDENSAVVRRLDGQSDDSTLSDNLLALSTRVEDLADQLDNLTNETLTEQNRLDTNLNALTEKTDDMVLRIDRLAETVDSSAQYTNDNPDSASAASSTSSLTAELEARETTASRSLSEVNNSLQSLQAPGSAVSIETVQEEISAQLSSAQATLEYGANQEDTVELSELLQTTRLQVQNLEQRVQDLPASTEAESALAMQSELQAQITALEARLEDVRSADPELQSTVMDVKEQVEQLKARGESNAVEYKIYFDRNSARITDDAAQVLNSFITQEQNRTTGVSIFGFTDRIGSAAYNQQLALQRATNVRSYLIQNGLDYTKIKTLSGLGEDAAVQVLPDNAADANQRVVILYADQR